MTKRLIFFLPLFLLFLLLLFFSRQHQDNLLLAPGRDWDSPKKVEDYFIEYLHMPKEEANSIRSRQGSDGKINLRINSDTTLVALIGNLYYYGFIRDKAAFESVLISSKDTTPAESFIPVGDGSIETNASFRISEDLSARELADILLNHPTDHFSFDEYHYFFMP